MTIDYEAARRDLVEGIENLADVEYQQRVWIQGIAPPNVADSFDDAINDVFGTPWLELGPEEYVGTLLRKEEEFTTIRTVQAEVDAMFDVYGKKKPDAFYLATPEWARVVEAAKIARDVLHRATE